MNRTADKISDALAELNRLTDSGVEFPSAEYKVTQKFKLTPNDVKELTRRYDAASHGHHGSAKKLVELAAIATELEKRGHADLARQVDAIAVRGTETAAGPPHGYLYDHKTGAMIRPATAEEERKSREASMRDNGEGVIMVDGRRCYVE
jgi:hypothetical protein